MLSIIAAIDQNRALGYKNQLLFYLPADLKHFKALTTGHTIVMGRNTYESLPKGALPNRRNVVLSRTTKELPGCDVYPTLEAALKSCKDDEDVYIIGGARVYAQAMAIADRLCLTEVDDEPAEADAFFPDYSNWQEVWREHHPADDRHDHAFDFVDYRPAPDDARTAFSNLQLRDKVAGDTL